MPVRAVGGSLQLSGRTVAVSIEDLSSATTVAAGSNHVVVIQPPVGKLWIVQSLFLQAPIPSGGTSGNHEFLLAHGDSDLGIGQGRGNFDKQVRYQHHQWRDNVAANLAIEVPSDKAAQQWLARGLHLTNDVTLQVQYNNNTNVDQTGSRTIKVGVLEENIS
jgi:hypothetical protein